MRTRSVAQRSGSDSDTWRLCGAPMNAPRFSCPLAKLPHSIRSCNDEYCTGAPPREERPAWNAVAAGFAHLRPRVLGCSSAGLVSVIVLPRCVRARCAFCCCGAATRATRANGGERRSPQRAWGAQGRGQRRRRTHSERQQALVESTAKRTRRGAADRCARRPQLPAPLRAFIEAADGSGVEACWQRIQRILYSDAFSWAHIAATCKPRSAAVTKMTEFPLLAGMVCRRAAGSSTHGLHRRQWKLCSQPGNVPTPECAHPVTPSCMFGSGSMRASFPPSAAPASFVHHVVKRCRRTSCVHLSRAAVTAAPPTPCTTVPPPIAEPQQAGWRTCVTDVCRVAETRGRSTPPVTLPTCAVTAPSARSSAADDCVPVRCIGSLCPFCHSARMHCDIRFREQTPSVVLVAHSDPPPFQRRAGEKRPSASGGQTSERTDDRARS